MAAKCLFIDEDKICAVTGRKCDDPRDDNCPSYQPSNEEHQPEDEPNEE